MPPFNSESDYQYEYHKLFMENELKLQQYDKLLQERVTDLKLYQSMKNGDFSHMSNVLAHQSTSEICK
mgnify:CR=1 FL=1